MPRLDPETGLKECSRCKLPKLPEKFSYSSSTSDGFRSRCRDCEAIIKALYKEANLEKVRSLERVASAKYYEADPRRKTLKNSRFNAQRAGVPHEITLEDIYIPEFCPMERCGHRRLSRGDNSINDSSPSLDRYHPSLGYVPGNVWIICQGCNRAKQDMSGEDHVAFGLKLIDAFKEECERVAQLRAV